MGLRPVGVRARRAATAAVLGAALVVAGCTPSHHPISAAPKAEIVGTAPAPPIRLVSGLRGYKPVDFGLLRLWVPDRYSVMAGEEGGCLNRAGGVIEGTQVMLAPSCPRVRGIVRLTGSRLLAPRRNSYSLVRAGAHTYDAPGLHMRIGLQGSVPSEVLRHVGPSPLAQVLAKGPAVDVPVGWRAVAYRGVTLAVPPNWPVVSSNYVGECGTPFDRGCVEGLRGRTSRHGTQLQYDSQRVAGGPRGWRLDGARRGTLR